VTISPPLGVSAVLLAGLVAMFWLAPPPSTDAIVGVRLPAAAYDGFAREVRGKIDAGGQPMTVERALAALAVRHAPPP
jgi:hypothetical protein